MNKNTFAEETTKTLIEGIKANTSSFIVPWEAKKLNDLAPYNPTNGKQYNGINFINLLHKGMITGDSRWLTLKDARAINANLKKGEEGTMVQYWRFTDDGVKLKYPKRYTAYVFNGNQFENMPKLDKHLRVNSDPRVAEKKLGLLKKSDFKKLGLVDDARSALSVEISSLMVCAKLGLDFYPKSNPLLIDAWISILKKSPNEIMKASADAIAITKYLESDHAESKEDDTDKKNKLLVEIKEALDMGIQGNDLIIVVEAHILLEESNKEDLKGVVEWIGNMSNANEDTSRENDPTLAYLKTFLNNRHINPKNEKLHTKKTFLSVPYEKDKTQINHAKRAGAKWDAESKLWYAPKGSSREALGEWSLENKSILVMTEQNNSGEDVSYAFSEALREAGLEDVTTPSFDSRWKRVATIDDDKGKKNGAYIGYDNGFVSGIVKNFRTGQDVKFRGTEVRFEKDSSNYAEYKALSNAKKIQRIEDERLKHELVSKKVNIIFNHFKESKGNHKYLASKKVISYGLREDRKGNIVLPLRDINGKMWSWQKIGSNGFKSLQKGGKKEGCFFIVGANAVSELSEAIIAEGYSTATSLYMATNKPIIAAIDAGNMKQVAMMIRGNFKDMPILIAGDNDLKNELVTKTKSVKNIVNIGKIKAEEAATSVGGHFYIPNLSIEDAKKGLSDFNDLINSKGKKAVFNFDAQIEQARSNLATFKKNSKIYEKYPSLKVDIGEHKDFETFIFSSIASELQTDNRLSEITKERIASYGELLGDKYLHDSMKNNDYDAADIGEYFKHLSEDEYVSFERFKKNKEQNKNQEETRVEMHY